MSPATAAGAVCQLARRLFSRTLFRVKDYLQLLDLPESPVLDGNLNADGTAMVTASGLDGHVLEYHYGMVDPALVVSWPADDRIFQ